MSPTCDGFPEAVLRFPSVVVYTTMYEFSALQGWRHGVH
jgi:hypothetical protein